MHRYISLLFLAALIGGCSLPKIIAEKVPEIPAEMPSDPAESLQIWKNYITYRQGKQLSVSAADYATAAGYARGAGESALAVNWAELAMEAGSEEPEIFLMLAEEYRVRDNLSKELKILNYIAEKYPELAHEAGVYDRLFMIYLDTDRDIAFSLWNNIGEELRLDENNLEAFFRHTEQGGNNMTADSIAGRLLMVNPENIAALEWFAVKYYHSAEANYQREMDKYERNKTHVQYQFLLNALKPITEEFRKSLNYFEVLWKIAPGAGYAAYMANIYTRFNNREKADYFRRMAQQ
jgi:hypothetical protein